MMAVPIIAAGALGSTVFILLAIAIIIHLLSREELGLLTVAAVAIIYIYMTSR